MRTITKKRLLMPSKVECAEGVRRMLSWDKKPDSEATEDISELLIMIRRKSGSSNALPEKTESTEPLDVLSSERLEPMYCLPSPSEAST